MIHFSHSDVGELLVIQKALYIDDVYLEPTEMDQIFYNRCTIGNKVCELIIGGGSCTNLL